MALTKRTGSDISAGGRTRRPVAVSAVWIIATLIALATVASAYQADTYETQVEQAVGLYSDGKYADAIGRLKELVRQEPQRKEAYLWLGKTFLKTTEWDSARQAYESYSQLDPDDAEGPLGVARAYRGLGKMELAKLWYRRALNRRPGDAKIESEMNRPEGTTGPGDSDDTENSDDKKGFWRKGLAGLCGARSSKGAKAVAIIIYALMLFGGAFQHGTTSARLWGDAAVPGALFSALGGNTWRIHI